MTTTRPIRRVFALGAAAALVGIAPGTILTGPIASAAPAAAESAIDNYGACIAGQRTGDLLLMIDESASLQQSDSGNARVTAANYLLDRLASFSATNNVSVDVAIAGFSSNFTPDQSWTPVTSSSVGSLHSVVDGFASRNTGDDTDYLTALEDARAYLTQRGPGPNNGQRCQAIAWFTDGAFDFQQRDGLSVPFAPGVEMSTADGVRDAVSQGIEQICRAGGVADQVRSSGIVIFGVGLDGPNNPDFGVMQSIVEGQAPNASTCGDITSPKPGDFHTASNINDLLLAFDVLSTPGQPPLQTTASVCQLTVCEEQKHKFVLDDSIDYVEITATSDAPGMDPYLVAPGGQPVRIPAANEPNVPQMVGVTEVKYTWPADTAVSIQMTRPPATWAGQWALAFVDPTGAGTNPPTHSNIHIVPGIEPTWSNQGSVSLRAGQTPAAGAGQSPDLLIGLQDHAGSAVDPASIQGEAKLTVELLAADLSPTPVPSKELGKADIGQPLQLDLGNIGPGSYKLRMSLVITTAATTDSTGAPVEGTLLAPKESDQDVTIGPKAGYPTIAPSVDFGTSQGAGTTAGELTVEGPGCVWVEPGEPALRANPEGIGKVSLAAAGDGSSKEDCLQLAEGEKKAIALELTTENDAKGLVNGTFTVSSYSADAPDEVGTQDVTLSLEVTKPLDQPTFWLTLVLALLLGPGVPLLLLYLGKWFTARIPAQPMSATEIPVTVEAGSVLRDGEPFALRDRDLVDPVAGLRKPARKLKVGSIELRTHMGRSPFGAGYVCAEKSRLLSASSETPASVGTPPRARLPLAVHNKWIVVSDPSWAANQGTVIVMAGGTTTQAQRDELAEDVARRLPSLLAEIRSGAGASAAGVRTPAGAPPSADPFGPSEGDPFGPGGNDPFGSSGDPFSPAGNDPFGPNGNDSFGPSGADPFAPSPAHGVGRPAPTRQAMAQQPPPPPPGQPGPAQPNPSGPPPPPPDPFGSPGQQGSPW